MPHAWQRLTNGRSCSKIDILIWRTRFEPCIWGWN
jgi:hypothetical protein